MLPSTAIVLVIFVLAVVMIMSGRGGGNFYVITLILAGVPVHAAATTSQFILLASALAGALIFGKARATSWRLALLFGGLNAAMAFFGGSSAHQFSGTALKAALSVLLAAAGAVMLLPEKETVKTARARLGYWTIVEGDDRYVVNVWVALPMVLATGFFSGMVGISGGSFLVPLMVVGCGVPVRTAVGTATVMLAATASAGFAGHALHGGFDPALAVPCGAAAVAGGLIGGRLALKVKPRKLRRISGAITIVAAAIMMANALTGK